MATQTETRTWAYFNGGVKRVAIPVVVIGWLLTLSWNVFQYSSDARADIERRIECVQKELNEYKLKSTELVVGLPTMHRIDTLESAMRQDLKAIAADIVRLREDVSAIKQRVGP